MTGSLLGISLAAGVIVGLGLHLAVWRARPSTRPRIRLLAGLAALSLAASVATYALLGGRSGVELCALLWIETFLMIAYFFVYAGVARSVSVTILSSVLRAPDGQVRFAELLDSYERSSRFADRLALMAEHGLVEIRGQRVSLAPRGAALSRVVSLLNRLTATELQG